MQTIAVLITCFNRKEKTLECLEHLHSQLPVEGYETDVYLTNDGCTDGTPEAVRERFPEVHIIDGNGNLYWNRGMYTAWTRAAETKDYDFFLWLNDDTDIYDTLFHVLLESSQSSHNKAIIVGATENQSGIMTYGGIHKGTIQKKPNGKLIECDFFNGNIVLVPSYVFKKTGNLDYFYRHDKGDIDYGIRAALQGIKIFQAPQYLGHCENHGKLDDWCNPYVPFIKRWKSMFSITGINPKEMFHLSRKSNGYFKSCFCFCSIILRCIFPIIWVKTGRAKVYKSLDSNDKTNQSLINKK